MTELERRFLDLVGRNEGRLEHLCRVYAADPDDAEDLRQEILAQLWRSLPTFRGDSGEGTWLYRVALNTALSSRRRRESRPRLEHRETPVEGVDRDPPPDERLERLERVERLHDQIRELDPIERAIVTMYLDDRSYREIAEVLGTNENNVGVKLHRIRKKLMDRMREAFA